MYLKNATIERQLQARLTAIAALPNISDLMVDYLARLEADSYDGFVHTDIMRTRNSALAAPVMSRRTLQRSIGLGSVQPCQRTDRSCAELGYCRACDGSTPAAELLGLPKLCRCPRRQLCGGRSVLCAGMSIQGLNALQRWLKGGNASALVTPTTTYFPVTCCTTWRAHNVFRSRQI